jgi:hypothetical protein
MLSKENKRYLPHTGEIATPAPPNHSIPYIQYYKEYICIDYMFNFTSFQTLTLLTHLKSLPSNFRGFVNTTVLAGMFKPRANVSVANNA